MGGQVIIDNRGGANTIIGTDFVAKSKADGYTWLLGVQGSLAINPAFYSKLPYDAVKHIPREIERYRKLIADAGIEKQ